MDRKLLGPVGCSMIAAPWVVIFVCLWALGVL